MVSVNNISGFPELLPEEQRIFSEVLHKIRAKFKLYGFSELDTAAVEKVSDIASKSSDNEIYGVCRLSGDGNAAVKLALRFDLTVPLARYVSQHYGVLKFPYRRYHIAPVWRGERPQSGRYRQFYQCDVDIIGSDTEELDIGYDAELVELITDVFESIGLGEIEIKINHRAFLQGILEHIGIASEKVAHAMRVIDKKGKMSDDDIIAEIVHAYDIDQSGRQALCDLIKREKGIEYWRNAMDGSHNIRDILDDLYNLTSNYKNVTFAPYLARGLGYYTGIVYEVELKDHREIGSVCGGGRYENLTRDFCKKSFPGVGVSFGVTRMMDLIIATSRTTHRNYKNLTVIVSQSDKLNNESRALIAHFRKLLIGNSIENLALLRQTAMKKKMKYADSIDAKFVLICIDYGSCIIKNMESGEQAEIGVVKAIEMLKQG